MELIIWSGLLIPLVSFLIIMAFSSFISRSLTHVLACGSVLLSFLCFCYLTATYISPVNTTLFQWIPALNTDFALHVDSLSLLMTLIITGVGFWIHVYSTGYMEHEEDYARYFGCLNLFIFMMLLLVLAKNLIVLFIGWEGVGLVSYLLIGYFYTRPAAASAATKAFVVNRIGDLGLLLGILLCLYHLGTTDMQAINSSQLAAGTVTLITLLFFLGATGKSAQIPLFTWLPDAMEGPTPVSALIHAATMVTAGIYLIVRLFPFFSQSPETLQVVGAIGAATAFVAALCALAQTDLKKVLAYSTVSQLGYMFVACGVGAFYAAMFHLTMHAFVKALLFLTAGNVLHAMNGNTDMYKMGGLKDKLPKTHWLFLIGILAMAGLPPLSAFFSKDLILEETHHAGFKTLFYVGWITSILTAFYLTRAYVLTFWGQPKLSEKIMKVVHEAPAVMLVPISILAIFSVFGGWLGFMIGQQSILEAFLGLPGDQKGSWAFFYSFETLMSVAGAILGIIAAVVLYTRYADKLGPNVAVLKNAFYLNEIYDTLFVAPLKTLSRFIDRVMEPEIMEGGVRAVTQASKNVAVKLQQFQSGQIRSYIAWMVLGGVGIIFYLILMGR